ncbi:MAG: sigma-70 family RNA polymerase sigma factor [Peptococcaceae bacterium]|nr:sigma-70 family RNA polymerase sigma factor [Peptococcaceae bacterium]
MNEAAMIHGLKKQKSEILGALMDHYIGYVSAIVRGIIGTSMSNEDVEEVVSDVFLAVWNNSDKLQKGKVKAYIGAIARNRAKNKLRELCSDLALEEDVLTISIEGPEENLDMIELSSILKEAIGSLSHGDQEIFWRYYYYSQKTAQIAQATMMSDATIRTKLARGRRKIGEFITERGYYCESENNGSHGQFDGQLAK